MRPRPASERLPLVKPPAARDSQRHRSNHGARADCLGAMCHDFCGGAGGRLPPGVKTEKALSVKGKMAAKAKQFFQVIPRVIPVESPGWGNAHLGRMVVAAAVTLTSTYAAAVEWIGERSQQRRLL